MGGFHTGEQCSSVGLTGILYAVYYVLCTAVYVSMCFCNGGMVGDYSGMPNS